MANEQQQAAQAAQEQVKISAEGVDATYANLCRVTSTPEEVIMDFAVNPNAFGKVLDEPLKLNHRIIMNYHAAKRVALILGVGGLRVMSGGMTIGATLTNFGTNMQLSGRDTRTFIRLDPSKQGSSDKVPTDIEMESWNLPLLLQFGVSTDVLKNESTRWTVAADALHPSDDYESMNIGTGAVLNSGFSQCHSVRAKASPIRAPVAQTSRCLEPRKDAIVCWCVPSSKASCSR